MLTYPLSPQLLILTASFAPPPFSSFRPTADCQKNNFPFSPDSLLSLSRLLFVSPPHPQLRAGVSGAEVLNRSRYPKAAHPPALPPRPGREGSDSLWVWGRCGQVTGTLSPPPLPCLSAQPGFGASDSLLEAPESSLSYFAPLDARKSDQPLPKAPFIME